MLCVGSLVIPKTKVLCLTPDSLTQDLEDLENWPEWNHHEIGVVVSIHKNLAIKVLISSGVGYCFFDELKKIS